MCARNCENKAQMQRCEYMQTILEACRCSAQALRPGYASAIRPCTCACSFIQISLMGSITCVMNSGNPILSIQNEARERKHLAPRKHSRRPVPALYILNEIFDLFIDQARYTPLLRFASVPLVSFAPEAPTHDPASDILLLVLLLACNHMHAISWF